MTDAKTSTQPPPGGSSELQTAQPPPPVSPPRAAGVPRKFGVGVLLVITTMYALLFGLLRAFGVSPSAFFVIVLFFSTIGLGQMLLFKGQYPREASVLTGILFLPCLMLFTWSGIVWWDSGKVILGLICAALGGAFLGYVAGAIIAAVFLVIDKVKATRVPPTNETPPNVSGPE